MKIPLSKPFEYEDFKFSEIDLDLTNAPANVLRRADADILKRKHVPSVKQLDTLYCGLIASYVTKIPYDVLEALPLPDFNLITSAVSGFLLNSEEATQTSPQPSDE
jgi:hypothetical protein